jgi:hypothetical protein
MKLSLCVFLQPFDSPPARYNYGPQLSVLKYRELVLFPECKRPVFTPIKTVGYN